MTSPASSLSRLGAAFASLLTISLDVDGTLAGNSDLKAASQKAIKTYSDAAKAAAIATAAIYTDAAKAAALITAAAYTDAAKAAALVTAAAYADSVGAAAVVTANAYSDAHRIGTVTPYGVSNSWLTAEGGTSGTVAVTLNRLYMVPIKVRRARTFTQLAISVSALVAASNARIGIYNMNDVGQPTTLILDAGTVVTSSVNIKTITGLTMALTPGDYYLAVVFSHSPTMRSHNASPRLGMLMSAGSAQPINNIFRAFAYGALPADESAQAYSAETGAETPIIGIA